MFWVKAWISQVIVISSVCSIWSDNGAAFVTEAFQPQVGNRLFNLPAFAKTKWQEQSLRKMLSSSRQPKTSPVRVSNPAQSHNNEDAKSHSFGFDSILLGKDNSKRRRVAKNVARTLSSLRSHRNMSDSKTNNIEFEESNGLNAMTKISLLEQENDILRRTIASLEDENSVLLKRNADVRRVVIEQFEGEGRQMVDVNGEEVEPWWDDDEDDENNDGTATSSVMMARAVTLNGSYSSASGQVDEVADNCDDGYDEDACPLEPDIAFKDALRDRAKWLIGLLAMQSMSGFILARNEQLLQAHPIIVYFLTMLVGAGGNAGNQASVRVIRGLALGTLNDRTQKQFLNREFKMACALSVLLSAAGFFRAVIFRTPLPETIAITSALALIVFSSICLGAILPLFLKKLDVDPAHSSTTIQVVMDILGVVLTVLVSTSILDGPFGQYIINALSR